MNRFYQILNWISTGCNTASRPSLLKHFSGELIDECLDNGYLVEIRRNAFNEKVARTALPHLLTSMLRSQNCRKTRRCSKKVFPRLSPTLKS